VFIKADLVLNIQIANKHKCFCLLVMKPFIKIKSYLVTERLGVSGGEESEGDGEELQAELVAVLVCPSYQEQDGFQNLHQEGKVL